MGYYVTRNLFVDVWVNDIRSFDVIDYLGPCEGYEELLDNDAIPLSDPSDDHYIVLYTIYELNSRKKRVYKTIYNHITKEEIEKIGKYCQCDCCLSWNPLYRWFFPSSFCIKEGHMDPRIVHKTRKVYEKLKER